MFIIGKPEILKYIIGLILIFTGGVIRTWASGYILKSEKLATSGPYAYCRNPLYFGSFLIGIGFCFTANILLMLPILIVLYFVFYYPTILQEENFLRQKFNKDYIGYCKDVPRFIPNFIKRSNKNFNNKFSLKQAKKNREPITSFVIIGLGLLIGLKL
jgi:protein-S-isoprenylcysteine O-methyltransferase Ste14